MRFSHITEDVFSGETAVRVLRTLVARPMRPFTGRELARESGTPALRTLQRLRVLESYGLVESRQAGRAILWSLRPSHVLHPALRAWFDFERGLRESLREEIRSTLAGLPYVRRVVLFGSVARMDERARSDIDLFVVVDHEGHVDKARQVMERLRARIGATFTNPLRPFIYHQKELEAKRHLALVRNIEREGIVLVDKLPVRTEKLERSKGLVYLRKAEEFARSMNDASARADWNAVGLNAVHAVISACDALTTAFLGVRSRSQDHEEVAKLIRNLPVNEAPAKADTAVHVIQLKNLVEYEARDLDPQEAEMVCTKVGRFLAWAGGHIRR
jgi:predicted nucleotidyltransferase